MGAYLECIVAYAVRQRLIKSKPEWMQRAGENVATPVTLPVPPGDNGCSRGIACEINRQSNLPAGELPNAVSQWPGASSASGMKITSPSMTPSFVDQQVGGLVHPVAETDRREFCALTGVEIVVGKQRPRPIGADAPSKSLSEKCAHGDSVGRQAPADDAVRRYPVRMRYVLIMAGGSGKRLWPLSRQDMPKQLLRVVGGKSLLRIAYERLDGIVPPEQVLVCTGADYADMVAAELPELPAENILGEPEGRDSLNAVAWPAAVLAARDPDAVIAVVTADQLMHPVSAFQSALREAFEVAEADPTALVTFGVVPTAPHTGYGYLQRGEDAAAGIQTSHGASRSRRSPTAPPPRSTSPRVSTGGTRACSSGAPRPCSTSSGCCCPRPTPRYSSWPPHPTGWPRSTRSCSRSASTTR